MIDLTRPYKKTCSSFFLFRLFPSSLSLGLSKTPLTRNWRRSRVKKEILVKSHGSHSCLWWGSSSTYIPLLPISSFYSSLLFFIAHSTNKWKYSTIYMTKSWIINSTLCIDWTDIDSFWCLGCNHVHLTVRLGFVTEHLWLGDFGKCNRGLRARTPRLRYTKSSVTSLLS